LASVKDGIAWNELSSIPPDIADGDQIGLTQENDTLDSVAGRGSSTSKILSAGGLLTTGSVGIGTPPGLNQKLAIRQTLANGDYIFGDNGGLVRFRIADHAGSA
jgi:hypothetical protein